MCKGNYNGALQFALRLVENIDIDCNIIMLCFKRQIV